MARQEEHLHGDERQRCAAALLLIDVINPLDFGHADQLLKQALPMADRLAELKRRAAAAGVPVIYANDNFGRWRSDLHALIERCLQPGAKGRPIVEKLRPGPDDYFVLKPLHSAFYASSLEVLLRSLGARTLVMGGIAANICVLFSANDAYMRDYRLVIPRDGVASNTAELNGAALEQMRIVLKADTRPAAEVDFAELK
jgi:nicotinamidase-related amidase